MIKNNQKIILISFMSLLWGAVQGTDVQKADSGFLDEETGVNHLEKKAALAAEARESEKKILAQTSKMITENYDLRYVALLGSKEMTQEKLSEIAKFIIRFPQPEKKILKKGYPGDFYLKEQDEQPHEWRVVPRMLCRLVNNRGVPLSADLFSDKSHPIAALFVTPSREVTVVITDKEQYTLTVKEEEKYAGLEGGKKAPILQVTKKKKPLLTPKEIYSYIRF
ncbi:hypothetical protein OAN22_01220 [Alphaproteobacteria bacterium]|nr:hypothetical protein [Alphaproteobacteria bacterium]